MPMQSNFYKYWFYLALLYLILDYGRPQDIFPIGFLRPLMLLTVALSFCIVASRKTFWLRNKQMILILLFTLLLALYILPARNNYYAFSATKTMILYLPFVLSIVIVVNSIERLKTLLTVGIALMIWVSLYGLTHSGVGMGNYFKDENDLSLYINMWLPFCYFLFIGEKEKYKKWFYGAGLIIGVLTVVVSFSRGGFLGLIGISFVVWIFSKKKIVSLIVIVMLALVVYFVGGAKYIQEMETITNTQESTAQQRLWTWEAAWKMFLDNPLGVGGKNFQVRFSEYQPVEFSHSMWGRVAHSLWFTLLPETGIPGVIIYFLLIFYNFRDIFFLKRLSCKLIQFPEFKYLHYLSLAFLASLFGFFISATFISVLYYAHYWYLIGVIVASIQVAKSVLKRELLMQDAEKEKNLTGLEETSGIST